MTYRRRTHALCAVTLLASATLHAEAAPTKDECVDAYTSFQDFRRDGKLSSAKQSLLVCAQEACPKLVRSDCLKALDELASAQPSLVFEVKDAAGNDLSAVAVWMDGKPLVDKVDGRPIEVDPGSHSFELRAEGLSPKLLNLVVREGERGRRQPVVLGAEAAPAAGPLSPNTAPAPAPAPKVWTGRRKVALAVGGAGVAGLVVGGVFGLLAISRRDDAEDQCPGTCQTQDGVDAWSSARSAGTVSTVAFVVGGAALATGAVLWLTGAPSREESSVRVGLAPTGLVLRGGFR